MFAIDIETMPNLEVVSKLPKIEPDSRLKDPVKIEEDIKRKKDKQIGEMALNPLYGKIACIGVYADNGSFKNCFFGSEIDIIQELITLINRKMICTWNGDKFDLDFIAKRGVINGLNTFKDLEIYREKYSNYHVDVMIKWAGYGQRAHLNDVAGIVLQENKLDFDFKKIPELIKTEEGRDIVRKYCLHDCKLTYDLAKKLGC